MFCLIADVQIRKATGNRKGLQDALQRYRDCTRHHRYSVVASNILDTGNRAPGTTVLVVCIATGWKDAPIVVDLNQIWQQLGVRVGSRAIELDENAPLTSIRRAMTSPHNDDFQ